MVEGNGNGGGSDDDEAAVRFDDGPTRPGEPAPPELAAPIAEAMVSDQTEEVFAGSNVLDFASAQSEPASDDAAEGDRTGVEIVEPAAEAAGEDGGDEPVARVAFEDLQPLLEALLFASDRPLGIADLKRLSGERDSRLVTQAIEALIERRRGSGIEVVSVANAYSLRTNPRFGDWVSKLVAGKPVRLSRAMLETLAIVAYRQPITRPEIDDVRGVDCGPVLKTLLDRNLIRMIGKSEVVGRPILYGTTPEFLRIFSLKDLTQLPTLRQFHELSAEHQAKVDEAHPAEVDAAMGIVGGAAPLEPLATPAVSAEPGEDEDRLIAELEEATLAAGRAAGPLSQEAPPVESKDS